MINLNSILKTIRVTTVRESVESFNKTSKSFLYHGTHIKNLNIIKQNGLIPSFGDVVKTTDSYQIYMDDEYYDSTDRVDGVLFFSDKPNTWSYSHFGKKPNINEAVLVIVKKNDSIYRKLKDDFYDIHNKKVYDIKYYNTYIDVDKLPPFIENTDYFSLEEQEPYKILHGDTLIRFIQNYPS